jgi:hypothetical protein
MDFERNERDLIVSLLQKFGREVAKTSSYGPDDIGFPILLQITNGALEKFGELTVTSPVPA